MNNEVFRYPILLINRENGHIEMTIRDKKTYIQVYAQITKMNDVETALKVWSDFSEQSKREILRDFSLVELVNTFSTRYFARIYERKRKDKNDTKV